jgi:uncharacterized repeat protein (TIGR03803 family)
MRTNWKAIVFGLTVAAAAAPAFGQIKVLASFNGSSNGNAPSAGVTLSGNTLYGTTEYGGATNDGVVFSLPITGGTPTVLASFNGSSNGDEPSAGLTLSGNTLYGTTEYGGASDWGVVFSLPITGGTPTVLASFNGSNGEWPVADLTLSATTGHLYGTTVGGGDNGDGVVYSLLIGGGTPTVLASFDGADGQAPRAGVTLSGNTLYGTTWEGGAIDTGYGAVFSVPITSGWPIVLASFNGSDGDKPITDLTLSGDTLYGTTSAGGANVDGEVFSLPITGGTPTVLASFNGSDGAIPEAGLTLSGNTLYGTTQFGGAYGDGNVFSLPITGGTPTDLADFNGSNGEWPEAGLTLSGNTLYGTTEEGGANGYGTVFSVSIPDGIPEPTSISILAMGAVLALRRRRAGSPPENGS